MLASSAPVKIRSGKPGDAKAIAGIFQESWRLAYNGIIPHAHLEHMIRRRGPEWWRAAVRSGDTMLVMEFDDAVVGYTTLGAARAKGAQQGEIYELYMAPDYQGLGLGERLFEAARAGLDRRGLDGLIIWALAENRLATDFYWRRGGRPVAQATERFGSTKLEKIAFSWS